VPRARLVWSPMLNQLPVLRCGVNSTLTAHAAQLISRTGKVWFYGFIGVDCSRIHFDLCSTTRRAMHLIGAYIITGRVIEFSRY